MRTKPYTAAEASELITQLSVQIAERRLAEVTADAAAAEFRRQAAEKSLQYLDNRVKEMEEVLELPDGEKGGNDGRSN